MTEVYLKEKLESQFSGVLQVYSKNLKQYKQAIKEILW